MGIPLRLPTEVEREAAARGPKGRRYAYGPDFDAALCNTFETHLRRTAPVGVFPGGETPEGGVDLSGNVWDWTSTLYNQEQFPYPYRADDGREDPRAGSRRVARGGSWPDGQGLARAAYRSYSTPNSRYSHLGFRVVAGVRPPSL
jgi:formylglycine-generating enzyme required for sulfatase activity